MEHIENKRFLDIHTFWDTLLAQPLFRVKNLLQEK